MYDPDARLLFHIVVGKDAVLRGKDQFVRVFHAEAELHAGFANIEVSFLEQNKTVLDAVTSVYEYLSHDHYTSKLSGPDADTHSQLVRRDADMTDLLDIGAKLVEVAHVVPLLSLNVCTHLVGWHVPVDVLDSELVAMSNHVLL